MSNDIDPHITEKYEIKRRLGKGVCCCFTILLLFYLMFVLLCSGVKCENLLINFIWF